MFYSTKASGDRVSLALVYFIVIFLYIMITADKLGGKINVVKTPKNLGKASAIYNNLTESLSSNWALLIST